MRIRTSSDEAVAYAWLPPALRALANDAVINEDGPHPAVELGAVAARPELVVLATRAIRVP
jgi:hypothetical protein